jgi:mannosyltransferase
VLASLLLGDKSFWLDEAMSVSLADPHRHIISVGLSDGGNFALYYVLLHAWLQFGSGDGYARFMSVIPAVLAVAFMFALARLLFDDVRTAALAVFVLAINSFFIAYAQEARGYSLLLLLSIVSTLFFVRCFQRPASWRDAVCYVISSVLMVYTHFFGALVLASQAAMILVVERRGVPWRILRLAAAAIALTLVPLVYFAHRRGSVGIAWIAPTSAAAVGGLFEALAGGLLMLVFYAVLCACALVDIRKDGTADRSSVTLPPLRLLLIWLLLPIAIAVAFSALVTPIFIPRYLIICLPPLVLLVGAGLARIRRPVVLAVVGTLFVAASAQALWLYYLREPKDDWRGVAAFIASRVQPGDAVICNPPWVAVPFVHAMDRLPAAERPSPKVDTTPLVSYKLGDPRSAPAHAFFTSVSTHPRVWLLLSGSGFARSFEDDLNTKTTRIVGALTQSRRLSARRTFVGVELRLYAKPSSDGGSI